MSYFLYNTEGIILDYHDIGEADRTFSVFTKDFGKIHVFAKGARLQKSKLAPSLDLFSHSRISFVSGKNIWRLTDAEEILPFENGGGLLKFFSMGVIVSFLERIVQGEERDEKLWNTVKNAILFLASGGDLSFSIFKEPFEILTKARILNCLGYVSLAAHKGKKPHALIDSFDYSKEILNNIKKLTPLLNDLIAKGVFSSAL